MCTRTIKDSDSVLEVFTNQPPQKLSLSHRDGPKLRPLSSFVFHYDSGSGPQTRRIYSVCAVSPSVLQEQIQFYLCKDSQVQLRKDEMGMRGERAVTRKNGVVHSGVDIVVSTLTPEGVPPPSRPKIRPLPRL